MLCFHFIAKLQSKSISSICNSSEIFSKSSVGGHEALSSNFEFFQKLKTMAEFSVEIILSFAVFI